MKSRVKQVLSNSVSFSHSQYILMLDTDSGRVKTGFIMSPQSGDASVLISLWAVKSHFLGLTPDSLTYYLHDITPIT